MFKIATLNKISPKGLAKLDYKYEIIDDVNEADGILVRSYKMHDMAFSKNLKAIARAGAGVNNIPLERCAEEGIVVFNTPGANANAVKELVFAGMFADARNIVAGVEWAKTLDPAGIGDAVEKGKGGFAGTELRGKTIAVIGLGAIGVAVANTASDLGMVVVGYDPYMSVFSAINLSRKISVVQTLEKALAKADYVTVHVPAMDSTKGMINADCFQAMKRGVKLVNFARGEIVDQDALEAALNGGKVSKYITDFPSARFIQNEKVLSIPHLGASTAEAEENCAMMAAEEIADYLENGNITNSVNFPSCSMGVSQSQGRIAIIHKNKTDAITNITAAMNGLNVIIEHMTTGSKGSIAYCLIDANRTITEEEKDSIRFDGLISVRVVK